jgi:two-component system, chemotaxis family, sensor kinase CheA
MPNEAILESLRSLLRRIGLELAFVDLARADSAGTLVTLVGELEAGLAAADPPAALAEAAATAGNWLSGPRPADLARQLAAWHAWMEESLTAWQQDRPLPEWIPASAPLASQAEATPVTTPVPPAPVPAQSRWQPPADPVAFESVAVLPPGADPEMMRLFCFEAEELLADIEQATMALEAAPDDAETLATLFRGFHTLKGNAAVMRLVVLQRLTHEVESLLDAARRGSRRLDRDAIDVVLAAADLVNRAVTEMSHQLDGRDAGRSLPLPVTAVIERVHVVLKSPPAADTPSEPGHTAAAPTSQPLADEPADAQPAPAAGSSAPAAAAATVPRAPAAAVKSKAPPPTATRPAAAAKPAASSGSVRVDTCKLDGLVDLVGELVIAQSMVVQAAESNGDEHLSRTLGQLRSITADLQRTAMAMRMVPIRGTFQKMGRLVRDVAVALGKEIRLVVEGEETELDRTVIEELSDPLVHMVRNAADHGLEPAAERLAAGKPAAGTVTLRAFHQGGHVVIQIADDGRGLDPDRIRRKAIERGLITADTSLDARDTLELIFAPGFSTAETVTDVSGRGVGMDVVRRNLERVRGKVEIDSVPGSGTTFTILMPLTLAIIEGLIVSVAGQRFVIPTLSVQESFRPVAGGVATVHGHGELVEVRGRQLPLVRLGRHLGIGGEEDPSHGIVVVLEAGHDRRCLLVDELVGKQEVVIKSLGETFTGRDDFAGAAILGDGRVGLILDTTALVRLGRRSTEAAA